MMHSQAGHSDPEDLATDELVQRVLDGRVEWYEQIIRRYQLDVARIAQALLQDRSATEELVQQVFVNAFYALKTYRMGEGFGRWIRTVARNAARQELRRSSRYVARLEAYRLRAEARLDAEASDADAIRDRLEALRDCVRKLKDDHAEAVHRRYLQGESVERVAVAMGRSVDSVRNMLFRVRGVLRECLTMTRGSRCMSAYWIVLSVN